MIKRPVAITKRIRKPGVRLAFARVPAFKTAVEIFVWSRIAIWATALFALLVFEPNSSPRPTTLASKNPMLTHDLGYWTDVWARWDSVWYLGIARHGYGWAAQTSAFFPLYPAGVRVLATVFGGHYVVAGIVLSLAATLVSFYLLQLIVEPRLGRDGAHRAVLYLAVFPMALFLQAVYAESLLLALTLGAFLLAERGHWVSAWSVAGLAILTRPVGVALLPALALMAWRSPKRWTALQGLAIPPAFFAVFPITLWRQTGDAWGFLHSQSLIWHRQLSPAGPFKGLWLGVREGLVGLWRLLTEQPADRSTFASGHDYTMLNSAFNVRDLAFLVLFLALTVVVWRRFGAPYGLFAAVSLAIPLSEPNVYGWPLLSLPRFGLAIFPLFIGLAILGGRPRAHVAILSVSSILLGLTIVQWATWQWMD